LKVVITADKISFTLIIRIAVSVAFPTSGILAISRVIRNAVILGRAIKSIGVVTIMICVASNKSNYTNFGILGASVGVFVQDERMVHLKAVIAAYKISFTLIIRITVSVAFPTSGILAISSVIRNAVILGRAIKSIGVVTIMICVTSNKSN